MDDAALADVARRHGIRLLVQFGSTVRGATHPGSDRDLAVLFERPDPSDAQYAALQHELQSLFPDRDVDLVVLNRGDPLLLEQVTRSGRLLFGGADEFQAFRLYAWNRFQDYRPYLERERQYVAETLERDFPSR